MADGTANQVITTDGAGGLTFSDKGGGGGGDLTFPGAWPADGTLIKTVGATVDEMQTTPITISGGTLITSTTTLGLDAQSGHPISMTTGNGGGAGGAIDLTCGNGSGTNPGGNINLTAGAGTGANADGGRIRLVSGLTTGGNADDRSGHISFIVGSSAGSVQVGEVVIANAGVNDGIHLVATQTFNTQANRGLSVTAGAGIVGDSSDTAGHITGGVGISPITVTFARAYASAPFVVVSADASAVHAAVTTTTTTHFIVTLSATPSGFYYHVIGGTPISNFPAP